MSTRVSKQARALLSRFSERERQNRVAQAQASLASPMSATSAPESFTALIAHFVASPNVFSPQRSSNGNHSPISPIRSHNRQHSQQEPYHRNHADSGSQTEGEADAVRRNRYSSSSRPRGDSQPQNSSQHSPRRGEYQASANHASIASRNISLRLKPEMFKFDGKSVDAYISRIHHFTKSCSANAVLANLSVGIIANHDSDGAR